LAASQEDLSSMNDDDVSYPLMPTMLNRLSHGVHIRESDSAHKDENRNLYGPCTKEG
jgi:hypothetical protein